MNKFSNIAFIVLATFSQAAFGFEGRGADLKSVVAGQVSLVTDATGTPFGKPNSKIYELDFDMLAKEYIKDNSRVESTVIDRYKSTLRVGLLCSFGTMVIGGLSFIGTPYDKSYFKTYCRDIVLPMATKVGLATAAINFLRCVGLPTQEQYVTSASDKIANLKINDASDLKEVTKKLCLISATLEHIDGRRIKMAGFDKLKTKSISLRDKYARDLMKVDARAVELAQARMDELD